MSKEITELFQVAAVEEVIEWLAWRNIEVGKNVIRNKRAELGLEKEC